MNPRVEICRISAKRPIFAVYSSRSLRNVFFKGISFTYHYMMQGTIKRLTDKGFGFITPDGGDKDLFFHSSALVDVTYDQLQVNDRVSFDTEDSEKGPRATNVRRV